MPSARAAALTTRSASRAAGSVSFATTGSERRNPRLTICLAVSIARILHHRPLRAKRSRSRRPDAMRKAHHGLLGGRRAWQAAGDFAVVHDV